MNAPCFMTGNILDQNGHLFTNTLARISGKDQFKLLNLVLTIIQNGLQGLRSDLWQWPYPYWRPTVRPG